MAKFTADEVQAAIAHAQAAIPEGRSGALVVVSDVDGVRALVAKRFGDTWSVGGDVEWHGGNVQGGISVQASW